MHLCEGEALAVSPRCYSSEVGVVFFGAWQIGPPMVLPPQNRPRRISFPPLIESLRPLQWVKNLLVFAAPVFAFAITVENAAKLAVSFVVFCAVASATYLANDLFDLEADRLHPIKRNRPLPSGRVRPLTARVLSTLLFVGGLTASWLVAPGFALVVASYILIQAGYNLSFKNIVILDVMFLASGFVLRAVAGGVVAQVDISPWFLFCVALLAFFIGIEKRKGELQRMTASGVETRQILRQYSMPFLEKVETAMLAAILLAYALWTIQGARNHWMMLTVPFVLYGILRYLHLSGQDSVERPEELLFIDRPLLVNVVLWVVVCVVILWLSQSTQSP